MADYSVKKSDAEWKKELDPLQHHVLRDHGTERPFTSPLNAEKRTGTFRCAGCGEPLFDSSTKYESGSGWPSFWAPIDGVESEAVEETVDRSHGMTRTEVHCARCEAHLGHVFPDGPKPTGLRYCINGGALSFEQEDEAARGA
jgi:peptide-methionine (R)-S-oxide reductase